MNNVILTKVKLKSIHDVALTSIASNKFRGDAIRLATVYVCDVKNDGILENIFSREELHYDELIVEHKSKVVMIRVNKMKNIFPHDTTVPDL